MLTILQRARDRRLPARGVRDSTVNREVAAIEAPATRGSAHGFYTPFTRTAAHRARAAIVSGMRHPTFVLASASPRRAQLLRSVGIEPEIVPSEVDESTEPNESPGDGVARLAASKASRVAHGLATRDEAVVLGADTAVVLDGVPLGKPDDDDDARRMLRALSGRDHDVLTGVHVIAVGSGRTASVVDVTRVRFRELDEHWIRWYVATGEPRDKAGAYGIQGRGAWLTTAIVGSWSNVVGLPLERLPGLLAEVGIDPISR
jgi:septum formation protein